jgi:hypothetical protein
MRRLFIACSSFGAIVFLVLTIMCWVYSGKETEGIGAFRGTLLLALGAYFLFCAFLMGIGALMAAGITPWESQDVKKEKND